MHTKVSLYNNNCYMYAVHALAHVYMYAYVYMYMYIVMIVIQELENVTMLQMSLREANKTCLISRRYVSDIRRNYM